MSEPIPESIPTSADPRSRRPLKRARQSPSSTAASEISSLMHDPSRPVNLPPASSSTKSTLAPPPEIVANVQGSSAGAGSGEFHVYKASRRREYERLRVMEEEARDEEENERWEREEREKRERDEERTAKNRAKRNKKKARKGGKPGASAAAGAGAENGGETSGVEVVGEATKKKKEGGLQIPRRERDEDDSDQHADFGVAEVVKENGIVIHDDD